jgi:hypothetical protein
MKMHHKKYLNLNLIKNNVQILHAATTKTEHKMKSRLLLNIIISQCTSILQLLTRKNQTLLIWWSPDLLYVSKKGGLYLKPHQVG